MRALVVRIDRRQVGIVLGLALLTSPAGAEDLVEDTRYYDVAGETAAEIWREMKTYGPVGKDGVRYNGNTKWSVRWRYPYARSAEGCATGPVAVKLSVVYTLPSWGRPRGASSELASQWNEFIEALDEHERGHAAFSEILEQTRPQEREYDQRTNHGATHSATQSATQGTAFFRDLAKGRTTSRD